MSPFTKDKNVIILFMARLPELKFILVSLFFFLLRTNIIKSYKMKSLLERRRLNVNLN